MYTAKRTHDSIVELLENEIKDSDLISINNTFCSLNNSSNYIYDNDEYFFKEYFAYDTYKAIQCINYGDYKVNEKYLKFDGYGNLESFDYIEDAVDFNEIAESIIENEHEYDYIIELEECYYLQLQKELAESKKMPIFEIEVFNTKTNQKDFLILDININEKEIYLTHEPTTKKEQQSKKLSFTSYLIDECFSLDEHLEFIYDEAIKKINESELFNLI